MSDTIEIERQKYIVMRESELKRMLIDANEKGYITAYHELKNDDKLR